MPLSHYYTCFGFFFVVFLNGALKSVDSRRLMYAASVSEKKGYYESTLNLSSPAGGKSCSCKKTSSCVQVHVKTALGSLNPCLQINTFLMRL